MTKELKEAAKAAFKETLDAAKAAKTAVYEAHPDVNDVDDVAAREQAFITYAVANRNYHEKLKELVKL